MSNNNFDVIIIGGSYTGLAAAMALGRALRKVLVIDSAQPCNRQTPQSHNFITHDGRAPGVIAALAKQQVQQYPTIQFFGGLARSLPFLNWISRSCSSSYGPPAFIF